MKVASHDVSGLFHVHFPGLCMTIYDILPCNGMHIEQVTTVIHMCSLITFK